MGHFRRPELGRGRFAWVEWARRIADANDGGGALASSSSLVPNMRVGRSGGVGGGNDGANRVESVGVGAGAGGNTSTSTSATQVMSDRDRDGDEERMIRRQEQHEGLDLVMAWSLFRILGVLICVLVLSVTAALLWIFLGQSSAAVALSAGLVGGGGVGAGDGAGGFRDAGDRVGAGVLVGIFVLLLGLTGMGGWIGVSWLVW